MRNKKETTIIKENCRDDSFEILNNNIRFNLKEFLTAWM